MTISINTAVERLIDARSSRRLLAPLSETHGDLTLEHAYAIQDALRAELERRGERAIGWKLGATSPPGQAVMGVKEPACGFLFPGQYASGAEVSVSGFANLGVEVEVAFRMRTELVGPGVTAATALLAVEGAVAALELLRSGSRFWRSVPAAVRRQRSRSRRSPTRLASWVGGRGAGVAT